MLNQEKYKLPGSLTPFQEAFFIHLIEWKWKHLTREPGIFKDREYDAILPESFKAQHYPLYRPIVDEVLKNHSFKLHKHFGHMASSQAACINLFTPILINPDAATKILREVNPSFNRLATDHLESGFQFEYWDEGNPLNDHTPAAGTDSDIAIAYYDDNNDLCLWLIEHKLTEKEFSTCGGYRSSGNSHKEWCRSRAAIDDNEKCYYQYACDYRYWQLSGNSGLFDSAVLRQSAECPFLGGVNQLWRNQLMAHAIESKGEYKRVHFSVVRHHENPHLEETMARYRELLTDQSVFDTFTSRDLVLAADSMEDPELKQWVKWYSELYRI